MEWHQWNESWCFRENGRENGMKDAVKPDRLLSNFDQDVIPWLKAK